MYCTARDTAMEFRVKLLLLAATFLCCLCLLHTPATAVSVATSDDDPDPAGDSNHNSSSSSAWPVEKRLTVELLKRYNQMGILGRPVVNSSEVLTVRLGLALIQILDLEENRQLLRTNCWLRFYWRDRLLSWENWTQPEYRAVKQIRVRPSQVWTPDIRLYNFADDRLIERREARIVVERSGQIIWIPQALLKTTCKVKILHFPFDTQICRFLFGSWTHDETQLLLDWALATGEGNETRAAVKKLLPFVDFNDYVASNEWATDGELEADVLDPDQRRLQLRSIVHYRNEPGHDGQGNPVTRRYRLLEYRLRMMRNPSFYIAILVVPCIFLSSLTLVLFCLPPEAPAKILLGMNVFVAFFILLLLLAKIIPSAVEAFPLIGCYYCVNMGMITLSTFLVTILVNMHFNNGNAREPMRPLLKKIMLNGVGRLLLVRRCRRPSDDAVDSDTGEQLDQPRPIANPRRRPRSRETPLERMEADLNEVSRLIRQLLDRQECKEARDRMAMEWLELARVLDRMFFCVYLVLIATFALLFIPRRVEIGNLHWKS